MGNETDTERNEAIGSLRGSRRRWRYLAALSIACACVAGSGIALASGSLDSLDSLSGASGSYTFTCDRTITGAQNSIVVSGPGTTCIINAHVSGSVVALSGASIVVEDSAIVGSVTGSSGGGAMLCGNSIGGAVSVTNATGFVLVGDPDNGCLANVVGGSITATNDHHGLVIVDNTVGGSVVATNDSGAGPLPGQTGPVIFGNHH